MSFKDIKGQDRAIAFLNNSMASGRVGHAYLFAGPSGVGKRFTALNFAKALNCLGPSSGRPCDSCISCRKIDSSIHPDVSLLRPEKKGDTIKIEAIRSVIMSVGLKPYEAGYKVCVIDEAQDMGYEAQNAFLKTLEEPPPASVLVLVTSNPARLFSTVVSRLQMVRFFPLKYDDVISILVGAHGVAETEAAAAARLSDGRPGEALERMAGDLSAMRSRIIKGIIDKTLFISDFEYIPKEDLGLCLDIMLTWYRDLLVAKVEGANGACPKDGRSLPEGAETVFYNADEKAALRAEAKEMDFKKLFDAVKQITLTASYLKQNANPKLAMSVLAADLMEA